MLEGKSVTFDAPPLTQLARIAVPRPLGDEVRIRDQVFRVERSGKAMKIATAPTRAPTTTLQAGQSVTLKWKEGAVTNSFKLAVCTLPDESIGTFAETGWRYPVGSSAITLVDGDCDGRYDSPEHDGWIPGDTGFVLPYGYPMVLGRSRITLDTIGVDGSTLSLHTEPLEGTESQLAALEALNTLRMSNGLAPVELDAELSRACTLHAQYLAANDWSGLTNPHDETPGKPGFTEEGRAASRLSIITMKDTVESIGSFWRTYYHRIPMISPFLVRVGIATDPPGMAVIDVQSGEREEIGSLWADPIFVPANGSIDVPLAFSEGGEAPREPYPNSSVRGMPLMLSFASDESIADFNASLVEVRGKKKLPCVVVLADQWAYTKVFGCLPAIPMQPGAVYEATFVYSLAGSAETSVVRFTTR